jgi:glycosyltransferase involved in cell wall biosynthesis
VGQDLVMAGIVVFLNEERHLPSFLTGVAAQSRPPDELLLVDDGSTDASAELARAFAADHAYAHYLQRPVRRPERDRLATAGELVAFQWALPRLRSAWDVVAKLDGDIRFSPLTWETLGEAFKADPSLGMAGPYQSARGRTGELERERTPEEHVRGGSRFYRRACLEQISPIPVHLGGTPSTSSGPGWAAGGPQASTCRAATPSTCVPSVVRTAS